MISVLLAGTDAETIKNFRSHIQGSFPGMTVAGAVSDGGKDIMPLLRMLKPDLIIADIRFFGANSVRMFQNIHEKFPAARFILYGNYGDGEYLKSGRDWGVVDFMCRPVKPADLTRCLRSAEAHFQKAELDKKAENELGRKFDSEPRRFRDMFLRSLLSGTARGEREIRAAFGYFRMGFDKGFTVLLAEIVQFGKIILTLDEREKLMLGFKISELAAEVFRDYPAETVQTGFDAVAVLLGGPENPENLLALCENLKDRVREKVNVGVKIGVGRTYENAADVCVSFREARGALRHKFRMGSDAVIPIRFAEPENAVSYRYPPEKEEELIAAAAAGDRESCRALLAGIFGALAECGGLPEGFYSKMAACVAISVSRRLSEQSLGLPELFTNFFPSGEALELADQNSARAYFEAAFDKLCAAIGSRRDEDDKALVSAAKVYIKERFSETFSLPRLALALDCAQGRIQRIFLDREGLSLFDFAIKTRLAEAKRLFRETADSDETVAAKVGYGDVRHFRSVFRQYEGTDAADYRARYAALTEMRRGM